MKKILFGVAALGLLGLAGAGLGLKAQDAVEANAYGSSTWRTPYLAYQTDAEKDTWAWTAFAKDATNDYAVVHTFSAGAKFKISSQGSWDGVAVAHNWEGITKNAEKDKWDLYTSDDGTENHNFVIRTAGTYRISFLRDAVEGSWDNAEYGLRIMINPEAHLRKLSYEGDVWTVTSQIELPFNWSAWQWENTSLVLNENDVFDICIDSNASAIYDYDDLKESGGLSAKEKGLMVDSTPSGKIKVTATGTYAFYVNPEDGSGKAIWTQVSPELEALSWASYFVANIHCTGTALPDNWDDFADAEGAHYFGQMTNGAKWIFITAEADNGPSATDVQKAAFIHDMCVRKYDADVFMEYQDGDNHNTRNPAIEISQAMFQESPNSSALVAGVIVIGTIVAIGGLIVYSRKRRAE